MSVERGYIVQDEPIAGSSGRLGLRFLFNPSVVSVSYPSYEGENINLTSGIDPGAGGRLLGMTNQILTFSILFDRMAEVYREGPGSLGVQVDIDQLKAMTGMFSTVNVSTERQSDGTTTTFTGQGTGVPMFVPMRFYFGSNIGSLRFYGNIQNFSVQYTHWTNFMTPTRCAVDITAALIPETISFNDSSSVGGGGGGSGQPGTVSGDGQTLRRMRELD
mgnify:FL=1